MQLELTLHLAHFSEGHFSGCMMHLLLYHRRSDALFRIEEYSFHMSIVISIFPPFFLHSNGSSERVLKHNLRLLPSIVNTHFRPHYLWLPIFLIRVSPWWKEQNPDLHPIHAALAGTSMADFLKIFYIIFLNIQDFRPIQGKLHYRVFCFNLLQRIFRAKLFAKSGNSACCSVANRAFLIPFFEKSAFFETLGIFLC